MESESHNKLLREFRQTIKHKYPDISLEDMNEITRAPWLKFKDALNNDNFSSARFKNLGIFKPFKGMLIKYRNILTYRWKNKTANMSEEAYNRRLTNMENKIDELNNRFTKK